ncbi:MAG: ferredoxin [Alteromonadaceae bacterium]|nr:MAG: ferredoxin [Alteromonadaceae bacterium]
MVKAAFKVRHITQRYLRPPGALKEKDFIGRCIRCNQCAEICPNNCIKFFGSENGADSMGTPYITPREKACILCMKCGDVCPTGAIKPIKRELEPIVQYVEMGKARVDEQLCLSYQGKSCGVCYRACPLADTAIKVGYMEQPTVLDACVGCGLCERSCIQIPQAIKVIPNHLLASQLKATHLKERRSGDNDVQIIKFK